MNKRFIFPLLGVMLFITPPVLGQRGTPTTPTKTVTTTVAPAQQKQPLFNKFKATINRTTTTIKNLWTKTKGQISNILPGGRAPTKVQPGTIQPKGDLTEFCKQFPDSPHCPHCGDGVVNQPSEECDNWPFNSTSPDACRTDCKNPYCGDGVVDPAFGEECEPGPYCTKYCHPRPPPPTTCECKDKKCLEDPPPWTPPVAVPPPAYAICSTPTTPWTKVLGTPGNKEQGHGIAVDSNGTIYIASYEDTTSESGSTIPNLVLRQLDTCGNIVWESIIPNADNGWGVVFSSPIDIDKCGNVYVAGHSILDNNIFVKKFDFFGTPIWSESYESPLLGAAHRVSGVAVHKLSSQIVVGGTIGVSSDLATGGSGLDIWIGKYNADGDALWTQIRSGYYAYHDHPYEIALDDDGNIYLTGHSTCPPPAEPPTGYYPTPMWNAKLSPDGLLIWERCVNYGAGVSSPPAPVQKEIVVGTDGTIYAALSTISLPEKVGEYSSDGTLISYHVTRPDDPVQTGTGIAIDASGNFYVTGGIDTEGPNFLWIGKYDAAFAPLWENSVSRAYEGLVTSGFSSSKVAVDPASYVYVISSVPVSETGLDVFLGKYTPTGGTDGWPGP